MTHKFKINVSIVSLSIIALLLLNTTFATEKSAMHVAFGDVPGADMLNFVAAVKRAEARGVKVKITYLQSEEIAAQAVVGG